MNELLVLAMAKTAQLLWSSLVSFFFKEIYAKLDDSVWEMECGGRAYKVFVKHKTSVHNNVQLGSIGHFKATSF